jgi:isopenicillin N synthase-like dioxygenase
LARLLTATPTIDLGPFWDGPDTARAAVAAQVAEACKQVGFFVAVDHRVSPALLERTYDTAGAFFDLTKEEKNVSRPARGDYLGYFGLETEKASTSQLNAPPDLKERFAIGRFEMGDDDYFKTPDAELCLRPNIWPARPGDLREILCSYYLAMDHLCRSTMRLFALALNLPERFFDHQIDKHVSWLVALNYPDLRDVLLSPGQMRAGAHRDRSCFTVVAIRDGSRALGDLQVLRDSGEWESIEIPEGGLVINTGSLMTRWTNGLWPAALHRVVNPSSDVSRNTRRQSLAFFFNPNYDVLLSPLPGCSGSSDGARLDEPPPITVADHLRSMLGLHTRGDGAS